MDEQGALFGPEIIPPAMRPLDDRNKLVIMETLTVLADMGTTEKIPHIRASIKEYFDQLKNLMEQYG